MFLSYELVATFGISLILSFTLSVAFLLFLAAKRGLLRVGAGYRNVKLLGAPLLVPSAPPATKTVELTPLATYTV